MNLTCKDIFLTLSIQVHVHEVLLSTTLSFPNGKSEMERYSSLARSPIFYFSFFFLPIPEPVWNITLTDLKRYQILLSRCAVMTQNSSSGNNNDSVLQQTHMHSTLSGLCSDYPSQLETNNSIFFSKMKKKKC